MGTITALSYVGYVPQIIKLLRDKNAEGLSIFAWVIWLIACTCGIIYSIILKRWEMIVAYGSEFLLSFIMFVLIIKYK